MISCGRLALTLLYPQVCLDMPRTLWPGALGWLMLETAARRGRADPAISHTSPSLGLARLVGPPRARAQGEA